MKRGARSSALTGGTPVEQHRRPHADQGDARRPCHAPRQSRPAGLRRRRRDRPRLRERRLLRTPWRFGPGRARTRHVRSGSRQRCPRPVRTGPAPPHGRHGPSRPPHGSGHRIHEDGRPLRRHRITRRRRPEQAPGGRRPSDRGGRGACGVPRRRCDGTARRRPRARPHRPGQRLPHHSRHRRARRHGRTGRARTARGGRRPGPRAGAHGAGGGAGRSAHETLRRLLPRSGALQPPPGSRPVLRRRRRPPRCRCPRRPRPAGQPPPLRRSRRDLRRGRAGHGQGSPRPAGGRPGLPAGSAGRARTGRAAPARRRAARDRGGRPAHGRGGEAAPRPFPPPPPPAPAPGA